MAGGRNNIKIQNSQNRNLIWEKVSWFITFKFWSFGFVSIFGLLIWLRLCCVVCFSDILLLKMIQKILKRQQFCFPLHSIDEEAQGKVSEICK